MVNRMMTFVCLWGGGGGVCVFEVPNFIIGK